MQMNSNEYQVAVIGGGIVGLGTALALTGQFPGLSLAVIEKEPHCAGHQTGHNSGVIHTGIYYRPGSHKARLCVEGGRLLTAFCEAHGIRFERCGKLIVATGDSELSRLQALYERGTANGVAGLEQVGPERAREIEPHAKAIRALYSPNTAIVDFSEVAEAMAKQLRERAAQILPGTKVQSIRRKGSLLHLETNRTSVAARSLINCGGLYADRIARMMDINPGVLVIPFRGEYYSLRPECRLVRGLIYPVPDPEFPFLGVHFTRRIAGDYEAGPNAVLAFAREGYRRMNVNVSEVTEMLAFPGFWRMARKYWRTGIYEWYRSMSRRAFLRALQQLVPELEDRDLMPGGSGVRAQLVMRDGTLFDDFHILEAPNAIHVLNAPSPAATASIAIGRHIAGIAAKSFELKR
jgi:L-2-hydroxyglutarate oxidase LhgO